MASKTRIPRTISLYACSLIRYGKPPSSLEQVPISQGLRRDHESFRGWQALLFVQEIVGVALNAANTLLDVAFGLTRRAFSLHAAIAGQLAHAFFELAFQLLHAASGTVLIALHAKVAVVIVAHAKFAVVIQVAVIRHVLLLLN